METKTVCAYETKITSHTVDADGDKITVYGLTFSSDGKIIEEFTDITYKKVKIEELLKIFKENDIDQSHIVDIVCDFVEELHSI